MGDTGDFRESDVTVGAEKPTATGKLAPHQFDFVAQAFTEGVPVDEIARAVGVEPAYLLNLSKRHNESFNHVWDAYRTQMLTATVAWRFRLARMLDSSYTAIENAIQGTDKKLAAEHAWKVLEAVIPQSRNQPASGPAIQMNFGANANVQTQLADTLTNVLASFKSLSASLADTPFDSHIKQGSDAVVQLGITDPTPSDAPLAPVTFIGKATLPKDPKDAA